MRSNLKVINTGVRLSNEQFAKLNRLAQSLNVSRNAAVGLLIEIAEMQQVAASVGAKKNTHSANTLAGERAMGVL